jgi:Domain of unknown function (DUF4259)
MGVWGFDTFENDHAFDWVCDLEESDGLSFIEETLTAALVPDDEYLEAPEGELAIAAADVLGRLRGSVVQSGAYTERVDEWVEANPDTPSGRLVAMALAALDRVQGDNSELRELWEESPDFGKWRVCVNAVREGLKG